MQSNVINANSQVVSRHETNQSVPNENVHSTLRTKVLLLTDSFLPHGGGSREYYNNIYRSLVHLGDSEVVILTKKVPGWREFDKQASSAHFRIRRSLRPLNSWKYRELPKGVGSFFQTLWYVLRHRPQIIHAGDLYPQGLTALILKNILGLPYVAYCHGEEITQTDRYRYQPRVRNRIYRMADAVVANSEFARRNLLRIGVSAERIYKITPGVDTSRFFPGPPATGLVERYGLSGKTVILTVARMVPRKGHRIALQAFAQICDRFPNAHYIIAGTGPEESHLREFVQRLEIEDRVTFAGFVPCERLPDLYKLCDIMLLTNREEADGDVEGFGIVFLEANATGKAVIGGRSGGAVEAVVNGTTGLLVDPDDVAEVSQALEKLILNKALRTWMGAAGALRARNEFAWTDRGRMLRELNCRVLASIATEARNCREAPGKVGG
jgi:phosphatidylinositol alpha-1,6-mannosyltransferase